MPCQIARSQIRIFIPQVPPKPTQIKPSLCVHKTPLKLLLFDLDPQFHLFQLLFLINHCLFFLSQNLRAYSHEASFPKLDYIIHKYSTIFCYHLTSYLLTTKFSRLKISTSSSSKYFQYSSNVCSAFKSITNFWWYWLSIPSWTIIEWY